MSATVAIAVISTPVVAIVGYGYNWMSSKASRAETRALASVEREHERELAEAAHTRDLQGRRTARAYDERREAYRTALRWALKRVQMINVNARGGADIDEAEWEALYVDLRLWGSAEFYEAYEAFRTEDRAFQMQWHILETLGSSQGPRVDRAVQKALDEQDRAAGAAVQAFEAMATISSTELASL